MTLFGNQCRVLIQFCLRNVPKTTTTIHGREFSVSTTPQLSSHKVKVQGVDIHYVQVGSGDKTLVCFPGTLGFAQADFGPQLKGLNKEKLTVLAWDPPGHGGSWPPEKDYSGNFFERDAHLLAQLMEKLGVDKYSALGWSQGGISAVHLAALYPQRVENLITLGTFAFVDKTIMSNDQLADVDGWTEPMKAPLFKMYGEEYTKKSWDGWKQALIQYLKERPDGDLGHLHLMKRVKCPTLIVQGAKDPVCPVYHAEYIHKQIPNSKLQLFPKGRHNLHLRYPEEFNALIENFILNKV